MGFGNHSKEDKVTDVILTTEMLDTDKFYGELLNCTTFEKLADTKHPAANVIQNFIIACKNANLRERLIALAKNNGRIHILYDEAMIIINEVAERKKQVHPEMAYELERTRIIVNAAVSLLLHKLAGK
ncbi:TPA: hypothetical protein H1005_02725 [archaeon]|uniref:Uncharacterized protein n=1 Tax=Candidatus Naiadarchaeum limnaeum TaxID=2756139 RepID=A0A832V980_9ARCH|nr:hypothetical protein [Candidatus Naiadarchaeales archaeon SRR2090153.bin1042]HIJ99925.1 hypothetical protein [Candidatus Naiadarchaeum limnaeum]